MVKGLRKSVQYIRRYSTKYAAPRREHGTQFRLQCTPPKLLDRSSPKFYSIYTIYIMALSHSVSECQSDECAVCHFCTKLVAMAMSLDCENCENQSSGSWDTSARREKVQYDTKLVTMATSLEESEKLDWIKKIHANTFHLVKRSWKSVQEILR